MFCRRPPDLPLDDLITLYRGLHDVEELDLDNPGKHWSYIRATAMKFTASNKGSPSSSYMLSLQVPREAPFLLSAGWNLSNFRRRHNPGHVSIPDIYLAHLPTPHYREIKASPL